MSEAVSLASYSRSRIARLAGPAALSGSQQGNARPRLDLVGPLEERKGVVALSVKHVGHLLFAARDVAFEIVDQLGPAKGFLNAGHCVVDGILRGINGRLRSGQRGSLGVDAGQSCPSRLSGARYGAADSIEGLGLPTLARLWRVERGAAGADVRPSRL